MSVTIGTKLGSHQITALLGKGGIGEVYKACDTRLNRFVAIKVLPEQVSDNSELKARFEPHHPHPELEATCEINTCIHLNASGTEYAYFDIMHTYEESRDAYNRS